MEKISKFERRSLINSTVGSGIKSVGMRNSRLLALKEAQDLGINIRQFGRLTTVRGIKRAIKMEKWGQAIDKLHALQLRENELLSSEKESTEKIAKKPSDVKAFDLRKRVHLKGVKIWKPKN